MRRRSFRVLLSLCLPLLLAASAEAQYQRPTPSNGDPPTVVDLELYDGASKSVTVEFLNLTPYDITFDGIPGVSWSITATDEAAMQDGDRTVKKSFMFVPVGIPKLIPGAPAQDFLNDGDPGFDSNYVDTTTHPYPMVFSWDDQGGFVVNNWVKWTVKGVKYPTGSGYATQDVGLGLWMYRNEPAVGLTSGELPLLVESLKWTFEILSLPLELENPLAWANAFLGTAKLAKEGVDFAKENTQENDGNKMWAASYVIPNPTSQCVLSGMDCIPSALVPRDKGDAVYTEWGPGFAGPSTPQGTGPESAAEAELVVSVHVFRGQKAQQCDPAFYPNVCPLGSEPIVMITVQRVTDFRVATLAGVSLEQSAGDGTPGNSPLNVHNPARQFLLEAGAGRIRQLLIKRGRPGLLVLRSIVSGLTLDQKAVLVQMIRDMQLGGRPTQQERQLVRLIADELQARLR